MPLIFSMVVKLMAVKTLIFSCDKRALESLSEVQKIFSELQNHWNYSRKMPFATCLNRLVPKLLARAAMKEIILIIY
jgi:hypothetical protein